MKACAYLGVGIGIGVVGVLMSKNSPWFHHQCRNMRRKLKKVEKSMMETFDDMDEMSFKKYQTTVMKKFNEIKKKVEDITVKDIKEKSVESFNTIKENLENFAQGLTDLASSS